MNLLCIIFFLVNESLAVDVSDISFEPGKPWTHERRLRFRRLAKDLFVHAFEGYVEYGFPADELSPVSCTPRDEFGGYGVTMVDVLDTLPLFGLWRSFIAGVDWAARSVNFNRTVTVNVFEATIRSLGGLMAAHAVAMRTLAPTQLYDPSQHSLVAVAEDLAKRLLPAFSTGTAIPVNEVCLTGGRPSDVAEPLTCSACAGTLLLEFAFLAAATRNCTYQHAAHDAMRGLFSRVDRPRMLPSRMIDVERGTWKDSVADIGSSIDSFYEYTLKAALLLRDRDSMEHWGPLYDAAVAQLQRPDSGFFVQHDTRTGLPLDVPVNALGAFWPGMAVLAGDVPAALRALGPFACVGAKHGMLPETFTSSGTPQVARSILRPELYESVYFVVKASVGAYPAQTDGRGRRGRDASGGRGAVQPTPSAKETPRGGTSGVAETLKVWGDNVVCGHIGRAAAAATGKLPRKVLTPKEEALFEYSMHSRPQLAALLRAARICAGVEAVDPDILPARGGGVFRAAAGGARGGVEPDGAKAKPCKGVSEKTQREQWLRSPLHAPGVLYDVALRGLQFLSKRALTKCGIAQVDVHGPAVLNNRMESFVLAETLKYLFLLFDAEGGDGPFDGGVHPAGAAHRGGGAGAAFTSSASSPGYVKAHDGPPPSLPDSASPQQIAQCLAAASTFNERRACVPLQTADDFGRLSVDDHAAQRSFVFTTEAHALPLTASSSAHFEACESERTGRPEAQHTHALNPPAKEATPSQSTGAGSQSSAAAPSPTAAAAGYDLMGYASPLQVRTPPPTPMRVPQPRSPTASTPSPPRPRPARISPSQRAERLRRRITSRKLVVTARVGVRTSSDVSRGCAVPPPVALVPRHLRKATRAACFQTRDGSVGVDGVRGGVMRRGTPRPLRCRSLSPVGVPPIPRPPGHSHPTAPGDVESQQSPFCLDPSRPAKVFPLSHNGEQWGIAPTAASPSSLSTSLTPPLSMAEELAVAAACVRAPAWLPIESAGPPHRPPAAALDAVASALGGEYAKCALPSSPFVLSDVVSAYRRRVHAPYSPHPKPPWPPAYGVGVALDPQAVAAAVVLPGSSLGGSSGGASHPYAGGSTAGVGRPAVGRVYPSAHSPGGGGGAVGDIAHRDWLMVVTGAQSYADVRRNEFLAVSTHTGSSFSVPPASAWHGVSASAQLSGRPRAHQPHNVFRSTSAVRAARYSRGFGTRSEALPPPLGGPLTPRAHMLAGVLGGSVGVPPRGGAFPLWTAVAEGGTNAVGAEWAFARPRAPDLAGGAVRGGDLRAVSHRLACPAVPPVPAAGAEYLVSYDALLARCDARSGDREPVAYSPTFAQGVATHHSRNLNVDPSKADSSLFTHELVSSAPPRVAAVMAQGLAVEVLSAEGQLVGPEPVTVTAPLSIVDATFRHAAERVKASAVAAPAPPYFPLGLVNLTTLQHASPVIPPSLSMASVGYPAYSEWNKVLLHTLALEDGHFASPILGGRSRLAADVGLRIQTYAAAATLQTAVAAGLRWFRCEGDVCGPPQGEGDEGLLHALLGLITPTPGLGSFGMLALQHDAYVAEQARLAISRRGADVGSVAVPRTDESGLDAPRDGEALSAVGGSLLLTASGAAPFPPLWGGKDAVELPLRAPGAFPTIFTQAGVVAALMAAVPADEKELHPLPPPVAAALLAVCREATLAGVVAAARCTDTRFCNATHTTVARLALRGARALAENPFLGAAHAFSGTPLSVRVSQQSVRLSMLKSAAVQSLGLMARTSYQAAAAFDGVEEDTTSFAGGVCDLDTEQAWKALAAAGGGLTRVYDAADGDDDVLGVLRASAVRTIASPPKPVTVFFPSTFKSAKVESSVSPILTPPEDHVAAGRLSLSSQCADASELTSPVGVAGDFAGKSILSAVSISVSRHAAPLPLSIPHGLPAAIFRLPSHSSTVRIQIEASIVCGAPGTFTASSMSVWRAQALRWLTSIAPENRTSLLSAWHSVLARTSSSTPAPTGNVPRVSTLSDLLDTIGGRKASSGSPSRPCATELSRTEPVVDVSPQAVWPCPRLDGVFEALASYVSDLKGELSLPCANSVTEPLGDLDVPRVAVDPWPHTVQAGLASATAATAATSSEANELGTPEFEGTAASRFSPSLDPFLIKAFEGVPIGLSDPPDACDPLDRRLTALWRASARGVVAIAARGGCSFETKAAHASAAGAVAVIVVSGGSAGSEIMEMLRGHPAPSETVPPFTVGIPTVMVGPPFADRLVLRALAVADASQRASAAMAAEALQSPSASDPLDSIVNPPLPRCLVAPTATLKDIQLTALRASQFQLVRGVDARDRILVRGGLMAGAAVEAAVSLLRSRAFMKSIPWLPIRFQQLDKAAVVERVGTEDP